mmetsp:Transcript_21541/g.50696  ORF Transcript_21541/g.50696 Transcript_21541/m.50696 type:complete len:328 (-) Transcript_21541:1508-2491(-)
MTRTREDRTPWPPSPPRTQSPCREPLGASAGGGAAGSGCPSPGSTPKAQTRTASRAGWARARARVPAVAWAGGRTPSEAQARPRCLCPWAHEVRELPTPLPHRYGPFGRFRERCTGGRQGGSEARGPRVCTPAAHGGRRGPSLRAQAAAQHPLVCGPESWNPGRQGKRWWRSSPQSWGRGMTCTQPWACWKCRQYCCLVETGAALTVRLLRQPQPIVDLVPVYSHSIAVPVLPGASPRGCGRCTCGPARQSAAEPPCGFSKRHSNTGHTSARALGRSSCHEQRGRARPGPPRNLCLTGAAGVLCTPCGAPDAPGHLRSPPVPTGSRR